MAGAAVSGQAFITFGSPLLEKDEIEAVTSTLRSAWIGTGPRVQEFEQAMRDYSGAPYTAAVASCTAALHLSMVVAGVGVGDEVITTALTFAATANSIIHAGATPVLVDVERNTMNIDPTAIEAVITPRTKAIIVVHFAGRPCNMDAITAIAAKHNLLVIEDAAHAIEAEYKGRRIGAISPLTCYSFYVTKNITTGEGGMIASTRPDLIEKVKQYALHGLSADAWSRFSDKGYKHYEVTFPGFKYNLTDLQASLGLVQLGKIEGWLERRNEIWRRYDEAFGDLPCVLPAPEEENTRHARHLYTLMVDTQNAPADRDTMITRLRDRGIGTGVHYRGIHLHQYYRERFGLVPEDFPNASWISDRTLSLPLSAKLDDGDVDRIISAVRSELGKEFF
jgi:dTDP-4-amino-4,6-dideoxygalactose transaminase